MSRSLIATLWPWLILVAGSLVGLKGWLREPVASPIRPPMRSVDREKIAELHAELVSARSESNALRSELDRVLASKWTPDLDGSSNALSPGSTVGISQSPPAPDPELQERAETLQEVLAQARIGNREALVTFGGELLRITKRGRSGLPVLIDLYLKNPDPFSRRNLLPTLLFVGGPEARDFVLTQAETEADPKTRRSLLAYAANMASPEVSERLEPAFLQSLASGDEAERAAAIRGLRFSNSEEVHRILLGAASDASEKVRLAAMNVLASRGLKRDETRDLAAKDPEPKVREVTECRLMMAETQP